MEEFELIAKTFHGLEEVLAQELTELGADNIQIGHRMVTFTGDQEMMYRANFCLRTAVRILKPICRFTAKEADEVYDAVKAMDWDAYLDIQTTFAVDSVVNSSEFKHSKFVAYKVKDAIVDFFREKHGQRPNIRITNPDLKLNIHINESDCTLSLDASGESLHLRGYRVATVDAPINEVLAAGIVLLTGWKGDCDFIDPFCGSGTLLIEAALIARNIYPGVFRKEFAFEKWKDFDRTLLDKIYNDDSAERPFEHHFYGYDLNKPAVEAALANAKSAGVADLMTIEQRDFRKFTRPQAPAIIVSNPPYGERLSSSDVLGLYKAIGERLKHEFGGGEAWFISSREECFQQIGLKPSLKTPLYNGSLDCELRKYQLFEGKLDRFRKEGGRVKTDEELRQMGEKGRFKQHRDEFKKRFDDEDRPKRDTFDREFEEENPEYRALRNRHRDFERTFAARTRREGDDRPRRDFKSEGDRGARREGFRKGGNRKDARGERRSGGRSFGKGGRRGFDAKDGED